MKKALITLLLVSMVGGVALAAPKATSSTPVTNGFLISG